MDYITNLLHHITSLLHQDYLNNLLHQEHYLGASILLGIIVALCPCTMATNITAFTAMSAKRDGLHTAFLRGVCYSLGRAVAYMGLGLILFAFAREIEIDDRFHHYFGMLIGPIFILIGILMLDIIHIHGLEEKCMGLFDQWLGNISYRKAFTMGLILAFAFCPYSAMLYFGVAVPSSMVLDNGYWVPIFFSIGATLPLIAIAALFAYGFNSAQGILQKVQRYEVWFRRFLAILFIISGIMFILEYYFE